MNELIQRLEAATEGSLELDCEIELAVVPGVARHVAHDDCWGDMPMLLTPEGQGPHIPPHYTTSIDAALTLVPEGLMFNVGCLTHGKARLPGVGRFHAWVGTQQTTYAPTLPLALCIAALKAREHNHDDKDLNAG